MDKTVLMKLFLLIGVLLVTGLLYGQHEYTTNNRRAISQFEMGRKYYALREYARAEATLKKAIALEPGFIEAWLILAQVCTDAGQLEASIEAYMQAIKMDSLFFPNALYYLASNQMELGRYQEAHTHFGKFLILGSREDMKESAREKMVSCEFATHAMENPVPFEPVNLGPNINTEYDEYWPSLSADESIMVFTRLLPLDPGHPMFSARRQEDLFYSLYENGAWQPSRNVGRPLNTPDNEGAQSISGDGRYMVFTACGREDGYGLCDLYGSVWENGGWSVPINMGPAINGKYSEKQPSLSADGRVVYFTSDRPGGLGDYDIWMSSRMPDGNWSAPVNLGDSINSRELDQSPFIHPDNKTLYFSSTGWPGMGGFDLYMSRRINDSTWGHPVNLGYPINTRHHEEGLIVNARADMAYYSSTRLVGKGRDIFSFQLYEKVRPNRVSYMKGRVFDSQTKRPLEARFELIDLGSRKTVTASSSAPGSGEFLVVIPVDADYALNVSRPDYLFYSENFSFDKVYPRTVPFLKDIALDPIEIGKRIVLRNVFYKTDSFALDEKSIVELDKVVSFMQANPSLVVEIGGHTDDTGSREHNRWLSDKRAAEVASYLVAQGIRQQRIESRGYGMDVPVATNETTEGRAQNRRTELKILAR
jgi:outer membrane protein OmpA-like peptidoglycan-associated protein